MPFGFNSLDHTHYMREALKETELALQAGEYYGDRAQRHHCKKHY